MSQLGENDWLMTNLDNFYPPGTKRQIQWSHLTWIPEQPVNAPTVYTVNGVRQKKVFSSGELQVGDIAAEHSCVFQIMARTLPRIDGSSDGSQAPLPPVESDFIMWSWRGQVSYWNVQKVTWQAIRNVYNVECERIDVPPDIINFGTLP